MRPGQQNKRSRGRNNNGGRKHGNPLSRSYESNGPDMKVRGNAAHIAEKYVQLARDAHTSGDSVMAENYLQHAEHYFRIISAAQPQGQRPDQFGQEAEVEDDIDEFDPGMNRFESNNRFALPEPPPQQQFQQPRPMQPQGEGSGDVESGEAVMAADTEGAPQDGMAGGESRRRDRRQRRRGRNGGGGNEPSNPGDPSNAPQPDVGDLPAFITTGNANAAE